MESTNSVHLIFGNPSNASADINEQDNYLLVKDQYVLSYNNSLGISNWASWQLNTTWLGTAERQYDFRADPDLPASFFQVGSTDYSGSGFDRGHLVPSADRNTWGNQEDYSRDLVFRKLNDSNDDKELYIVAGTYGTGDIGSNGSLDTIVTYSGDIRVSERTWKAILELDNPSDGVANFTNDKRIIAVDVPNEGVHTIDFATSDGTANSNTVSSTISSNSVHLTFGNPSNATTDINEQDNYLLVKDQYALSYNNSLGISNWASWQLNTSWLGTAERQDDFRADTDLPGTFFQVGAPDYSGSGFDRGHLVPSADRNASIEDNSATFVMTNMIPQAPDNNRNTWGNLEDFSRDLVTTDNKELYIVAGTYGIGGIGSNGSLNTITTASGNIRVSERTWKAILVLDNPGDGVADVTTDNRMIAVDIPNEQGISTNWQDFLVSVDDLELATGLDLFSELPDEIEAVLEAQVDGTIDGTGWIINEIHADPDSTSGDANGDGTISTSQDEFVELVNQTGAEVDISGWTLADSTKVRHTFPIGTIIPNQGVVVVFSGGTPTGSFGEATVQTASTGSWGLNNSGDTVTLNDGSADVTTVTYGSEGGNNQSLTRNPDLTGNLTTHSTATDSGGALFSPGTKLDGTSFTSGAAPELNLDPNNDSGGNNDGNFETTYSYSPVNITNIDSGELTSSVSDADAIAPNYSFLNLTIGGVSDGTSEVLNIGGTDFDLGTNITSQVTVGSTIFDVTVSNNGSTIGLVNSNSGNIPEADLESLIQGITYTNNATVPTSGARTIDFTTSDGTNSSNTVSSTISPLFTNGNDYSETLTGTAGSDRISGYKGQDTLTGDTGSDTFFFNETSDGIDVITDFTSGTDQLAFSKIMEEIETYNGGSDIPDPIGSGYITWENFSGVGTMVRADFDASGFLNPKDVVFLQDPNDTIFAGDFILQGFCVLIGNIQSTHKSVSQLCNE